jgi:NADH:ubiquinone oxidoreductase subunit E
MSAVTSMVSSIEKDKSNLIKALQKVQEIEGYISDAAIRDLGEFFSISALEIEGVVSFYAQFKRIKPGKFQISVCDGTACHIKGSVLVGGWISDELGIKDGETDKDGIFSLETVACLGCCSLAPVISINKKVYGNLDRKSLLKILKEYKKSGAAL